MPKWATYLLSSLIAGGLAWTGAFLAVASSLTPGETISEITWLVTIVTGIAAGLKDLQAHMAEPPR